MTDAQRREVLHRTSVSGNTVAGAAGAAFGAAKLRDLHAEQYPKAHKTGLALVERKVPKLVGLAAKKPGFKTAAIGGAAGAVAAGAHKLNDHRAHKVSKAFGVEVAKFQESPHERAKKVKLAERTKTAAHPPPIKRKKVESSAINSLGYRRQTRQMDVEFHSRPGRPYTYRMSPSQAADFQAAPSKGKHYTGQVKGKIPGGQKVRVRDRARLFADPNVSKSEPRFRPTPRHEVPTEKYKPAHTPTARKLKIVKTKVMVPALIHSERIYRAGEGAVDLFKGSAFGVEI